MTTILVDCLGIAFTLPPADSSSTPRSLLRCCLSHQSCKSQSRSCYVIFIVYMLVRFPLFPVFLFSLLFFFTTFPTPVLYLFNQLSLVTRVLLLSDFTSSSSLALSSFQCLTSLFQRSEPFPVTTLFSVH